MITVEARYFEAEDWCEAVAILVIKQNIENRFILPQPREKKGS